VARWVCFALALLQASAIEFGSAPAAAQTADPNSPWANSLGLEPVVLPGYQPISVNGTVVTLARRTYAWNANAYLPARIDSLGRRLTDALNLVLNAQGATTILKPSSVRVTEQSPVHAVVVSDGTALGGLLDITVRTRVEYDGVAMVQVSLTPTSPVDLDGLDFQVDVVKKAHTRALRFDAKTITARKKPMPTETTFKGPFQSVVDIADGNRSFWWFADDAKGWIWNGDSVTELTPSTQRIRLRQRVIGSRWRLSAPLTVSFNFLATPVRDMGDSWRRDRVVDGLSPTEGELGRIHAWWATGFSHIAFPYTVYPPGTASLIPAGDRAAYPGVSANRSLLADYLDRYGLHRLPYGSLHYLTEIDPGFVARGDRWKTTPSGISTVAFGAYLAPFEKHLLSLRPRSLADYLISRYDQEIGSLGFAGVYLDQGGVLGSTNPVHGGWTDSTGKLQPSLDILGTREFLKRLRARFHHHGKPGYIFVHNSSEPIVPAYTFAWSTVDGEQFRHLLVNNDYIGSIPLDQARMQLAPDQYGVVMSVMPSFVFLNPAGWLGTADGRRAVRNLMTLLLLHDTQVLPDEFPLAERQTLFGDLDAFGVDRARFVGYWDDEAAVRTATVDAKVSYFTATNPTRALLVVGNLGTQTRGIQVTMDLTALGVPTPRLRLMPGGSVVGMTGGVSQISVPARDYRLLVLD
jgi:hypothetical protein